MMKVLPQNILDDLLAIETIEESTGRSCVMCKRPTTVCICSALPQQRVRLRGKLVVLQHPAEIRRRLTSVPLLELCLEDCLVLRHRSHKVGPTDGLGAVLHAAASADCPVYLLFPSDSSQDLATACKERHQRQDDGHQITTDWAYVLIAIDGTWRQGREMYNRLIEVLEGWPRMRVVHLPPPAARTAAERECLIKREPCEGCVMTAEAVARALGLLEDSEALREALRAPLRRMTALQAQFDPATAARLQTGSEMQPRGGASFGFRMPASLLPRTTQQQAHCAPTAAHEC